MLKKLFVVMCLVMLVGAGTALANGQEFEAPGWYKHSVTGNVKEFKNGHPGPQSEWEFIGEEYGDGCSSCPGALTVDLQMGEQFPFGASKDSHSYSATSKWWGNENDSAEASATGFGGFDFELYANADGKSLEIVGWHWIFPKFGMVPNDADVFGPFEDGTKAGGIGKGYAHTWSYAIDTGLLGGWIGYTSSAGAGATAGGKAYFSGEAFGVKGCDEWIQGTLWIGGEVSQNNRAGETDYPDGQFVDGGNGSYAFGLVEETYNVSGQSYNLLGWEFGGAELTTQIKNKNAVSTQGTTFVTIDPYDSNRSFFGTTQNSASVNFGQLNLVDSLVNGGGGVAGMVNNGGSYAIGQATFDYSGATQGSGNATISGSVQPGTVFVSGSAHAAGN